MTTEKKENAVIDFMNMIKNSWTFKKMTSKEQAKCFETFYFVNDQKALYGTYKQRWMQLHMIYDAYLNGLGYTDFEWRE